MSYNSYQGSSYKPGQTYTPSTTGASSSYGATSNYASTGATAGTGSSYATGSYGAGSTGTSYGASNLGSYQSRASATGLGSYGGVSATNYSSTGAVGGAATYSSTAGSGLGGGASSYSSNSYGAGSAAYKAPATSTSSYGGSTTAATTGSYGNYGAGSTATSSVAKAQDSKPAPKKDNPNNQDPFTKLDSNAKAEYAEKGKELYMKAMKQSGEASAYAATLSNLKRMGANEKYTDQEFQPNVKSLVGENKATRYNWTTFKWLRPEEFIKGQIKVFEGQIEPGDIKQGQLGDCYFLSAIASIAEWPDRIRKIFRPQIDNSFGSEEEMFQLAQRHGCYFINMYIKGEMKEVILDDFIPCISKEKGPAFTSANGPELWVLLLEKAWAKTYGSYDNIEAGLTREPLHDLTGAPTKTIWTDQKELWDYIVKGEKNNWAMCAGTQDLDGQDDVDETGLVGGHAYSLLAGIEVKTSKGPVRLVKLRNPWGQEEWNGKWADGDAAWNTVDANTKRELGADRKTDDGIFYMDFADFCQYFDDAQFCLINDHFQYTCIKATTHKKRGAFFKMQVYKKGKYFITVNQTSKRCFPESEQDDFEYANVCLVLGQSLGGGKYKYIEGQQKADREVWTSLGEDAELEPGEYIIYAKAVWNRTDRDDFFLSSYGEDKVKFQEITKNDAKGFLEGVYIDHAKRVSSKAKDFASQKEPKSGICVDQTDDGFGYICIWNGGSQTMNAEFKFKQLGAGMKIRKPHTGMNVNLKCPPGEAKIALIRIKGKAGALGYSQSVTFN